MVRLYKAWEHVNEAMGERMKQFVCSVRNLMDRYWMASELGMSDVIASLKEVHPGVCEWCEKNVD
jgi:hypothetical protein